MSCNWVFLYDSYSALSRPRLSMPPLSRTRSQATASYPRGRKIQTGTTVNMPINSPSDVAGSQRRRKA